MSPSDISQLLANAGKDHLVNLTKVLNNDASPGPVDTFMDSVSGRGHRIVFGHDASYLPEIFDKFGAKGVYDYVAHLSKDVMSPDGIPVPFAHQIQQGLGLTTKQSLDWLCLNIGDIVGGGFSLWNTFDNINTLQSGEITKGTVLTITLSSGLKIAFAITSGNPLSLASGLIDFGALGYYGSPLIEDKVGEFVDWASLNIGEMTEGASEYLREISQTLALANIGNVTDGASDYLQEISQTLGLAKIGNMTDGAYDYLREIPQTLGLASVPGWSLTVGDAVVGSLSGWHTARIINKLRLGETINVPMTMAFSGLKTGFSILNNNPLSLASGLVDFSALAYHRYPQLKETASSSLNHVVALKDKAKDLGNDAVTTSLDNIATLKDKALSSDAVTTSLDSIATLKDKALSSDAVTTSLDNLATLKDKALSSDAVTTSLDNLAILKDKAKNLANKLFT